MAKSIGKSSDQRDLEGENNHCRSAPPIPDKLPPLVKTRKFRSRAFFGDAAPVWTRAVSGFLSTGITFAKQGRLAFPNTLNRHLAYAIGCLLALLGGDGLQFSCMCGGNHKPSIHEIPVVVQASAAHPEGQGQNP